MKVIVCTMWSPSHQALADISLPILEEYCFRHDYRLKAINPPDNDCWFKKHEAFKEIFQKMEDGDIIWYVDIDTVIMNYNVRVEKFVSFTIIPSFEKSISSISTAWRVVDIFWS